MNKLLFLSLFFTSFSFSNEKLLNALIESDYETFAEQLSHIKLTDEQKNTYKEMANQMILVRKDWMVQHAHTPHLGKELLKCPAFGLGALIFAAMTIPFAIDLTNVNTWRASDKATVIAISSYISIISSSSLALSYFSIKNLVKAFQKPRELLANALRIKDAVYNA